MEDFWKSHRWPRAECRVHWHVLFDDQPVVHAFIRAYMGLLSRHRELSRVPPEWLHATVQSLGPLTPADADAVATAAKSPLQDIAPLEVEVDPAQAVRRGVAAALSPEQELSGLFQVLREVTADVLGAERLSPASTRFRPHMSLAYSNAEWDDEGLARALVELRPPRARFRVSKVVLVDQRQLWRDKYIWTPIATVPLGQGGCS